MATGMTLRFDPDLAPAPPTETQLKLSRYVAAMIDAEVARREAIAWDFLVSGCMPRDLMAVETVGIGGGMHTWRLA